MTLSVPFNGTQANGTIYTGLGPTRRGWIWRIKRVEWDMTNNSIIGSPFGAGYYWGGFLALVDGLDAQTPKPTDNIICTMGLFDYHGSTSGYEASEALHAWNAPAWGVDVTKSRLYAGWKSNQVAGSNKTVAIRVWYRQRQVEIGYWTDLVRRGR